MSETSSHSRLPPPAFPPGSRKHRLRHSEDPATTQEGANRRRGRAYISPDEPLPERQDAFNQAVISPDEPLPERRSEMSGAFFDAHAAAVGDGEAVGMNMEADVTPETSVSGGDPHVIELMVAVAKLAEAVRRRGEAGLRATPEMSRFEYTLRAYCVGYLAGRRAEEPPEPEMEEALPTDG